MRIAHVIGTLDPAWGGPPVVVSRLAAAQAALGQQVTILSYDAPLAQERIQQAYSSVPQFQQVCQHVLPAPSRLERIVASGARREIGRLTAGYDLMHLHGVWDPILKAAAAAARRAGVAYVIAPHGMLDPWSMQQRRLKKRIALALGYRRMLEGAAFLHVLNADERRLVEQMCLPCPLEVIPNGIFLEEIEPLPPSGSFYVSHPELNGKPYVLFLSRLHHKKGLDYLADAFAMVAEDWPEIHLVVAGPDGGAVHDFQQRIERSGIARRVHLTGAIYGAAKLAALVDASCFCLPSRQEGFSVAITEALGCGVPVVISEACHFPEVAEVGAGAVVALEAGRIAQAITEILSDPEKRRRMGQAGRNLVRSRFTWPGIAAQSLEAYKKALAKRNPV